MSFSQHVKAFFEGGRGGDTERGCPAMGGFGVGGMSRTPDSTPASLTGSLLNLIADAHINGEGVWEKGEVEILSGILYDTGLLLLPDGQTMQALLRWVACMPLRDIVPLVHSSNEKLYLTNPHKSILSHISLKYLRNLFKWRLQVGR